MDETETDKVKIDMISLLSSLEEVAQCPVCLELPKPPVTLCTNGHGTCTSCKASLKKCSICMQPYHSFEPRILNDLLRKIPRVCKFYGAGCRLPAVDDHEIYCQWRPVKCIFQNEDNSDYCDWEGPAKGWSEHVDYLPHSEITWVDVNINKTIIIRNFENSFPTKSIYENWYEIEGKNILFKDFVFYYSKRNGNFCLYIKHLPREKPTETIYFTLSFGSSTDDVIYRYKMKVSSMLSLEREVKVEENVYCMRVPLQELEKLVDGFGDLRFKYKITIEPL